MMNPNPLALSSIITPLALLASMTDVNSRAPKKPKGTGPVNDANLYEKMLTRQPEQRELPNQKKQDPDGHL